MDNAANPAFVTNVTSHNTLNNLMMSWFLTMYLQYTKFWSLFLDEPQRTKTAKI